MLIRGRHPLSPWHAPNARDKNCYTVVEGSVKEVRIFTLGHLSPSKVKANSLLQVKHLSCFITENDKIFFLPKFTLLSFPEFTLNVIILITLMYEVQIFPKLKPFSIRNYKVVYSLPKSKFWGQSTATW